MDADPSALALPETEPVALDPADELTGETADVRCAESGVRDGDPDAASAIVTAKRVIGHCV